MHQVVEECLKKFPELNEYYSHEELLEATSAGSYIFFEDSFNAFVENFGKSEYFFQRVGAFIEEMAASENEDIRNLAQIGLLEGMVNRRVYAVIAFLGEHSKILLADASHRTDIEKSVWLR